MTGVQTCALPISLDAYVGTTKTYNRLNTYNYPPFFADPYFLPIQINLYGGALTFQHDNNLVRFSIHDTYSQRTDGGKFVVDFPFVSLAPNVGYYQVDNQLPGPGVPTISQLHSFLYTFGVDFSLGYGFRIMGEYVRREINDVLIGPDSDGAYLALLKSFGDWTPYISMAHLQSTDRILDLYHRVNNNQLPNISPISGVINASQRSAGNRIAVFDQTTWAIGTSYKINPTSKLKAEWAITTTGQASSFVDTPQGQDSSHRLINVFSLSYSVVF